MKQAKPRPPVVDDIRQLPADLSMTVPHEWQDRNGHVNVQYYLALYELGGWKMLERLGFDERYLTETRRSIFDLENHLTYLAEIHVGDTVSTYNRMLGRSDKVFHGVFLIVNDSNNELAAIVEYLSIFIDMEQRKSAPFPGEMNTKMDELCAGHSALSWSVPLCGSMNLPGTANGG